MEYIFHVFLLVSNDLQKLKQTNAIFLSGLSRGSSTEKFLNQIAYFEIKSLTNLVTKYLMKFEKKIDGYFPNLGKNGLAYIRNPCTENA